MSVFIIYNRNQGFSAVDSVTAQNKALCFYGWQLSAIAADDYSEVQVRRAAKRLMRNLIDRVLNHKPLRSRELFQKM